MTSRRGSSAGGRWNAIAFDLDGTLIDSFADLTAAVNATRTAYGLPPLALAEVTRHVGSGTEHLVRLTVPIPHDGAAAAHRRFVAEYDRCLLNSTRAYPGVDALLARLDGIPLGLITNKLQHHAEAILTGLGWRGRFAAVLGGDTLPAKKPDPLPLQHFLKLAGSAPAEAAMIGDGVVDIRAGRAARMTTVAVTYGNTSREMLAAEHPDFLLDRVQDLDDLFFS